MALHAEISVALGGDELSRAGLTCRNQVEPLRDISDLVAMIFGDSKFLDF